MQQDLFSPQLYLAARRSKWELLIRLHCESTDGEQEALPARTHSPRFGAPSHLSGRRQHLTCAAAAAADAPWIPRGRTFPRGCSSTSRKTGALRAFGKVRNAANVNAKRDHCLLQFHGLWTKWERSCTDPSESGVSTFSCVLASSTSNLGEFLFFFSSFFFSLFTTCYYMRGLFFPPSHAQTCVKSNASLLIDLQESIGCPLTP